MTERDESTSLLALLGRVFWMMIGPLSLILFAFSIVRTGSGWLTALDVGYLVVLGGMLLARWHEFHRGSAKTVDGQRATPADWRHYVQTVVPLGLVTWIAANVIGNHLLDG